MTAVRLSTCSIASRTVIVSYSYCSGLGPWTLPVRSTEYRGVVNYPSAVAASRSIVSPVDNSSLVQCPVLTVAGPGENPKNVLGSRGIYQQLKFQFQNCDHCFRLSQTVTEALLNSSVVVHSADPTVYHCCLQYLSANHLVLCVHWVIYVSTHKVSVYCPNRKYWNWCRPGAGCTSLWKFQPCHVS